MQQTPFNWGIIAPGRIARNFAQGLNVVEGARLAAVASRNADRARAFVNEQARAEDNTRVYDNYADLVADQDIDAVYIANPHRFHYDAVRLALEAGKPVLCEKPLCVNAEQAETLVRLAEDQNVFLMEALWSRFLPVWQKTRAWLDEAPTGRWYRKPSRASTGHPDSSIRSRKSCAVCVPGRFRVTPCPGRQLWVMRG